VTGPQHDPAAGNTNGVVFWPVAVLVLGADLLTKAMAAYALAPRGFSHPVLGDVVRFTLVYNPGAAFGLYLGPYSRWIFLVVTAVVLRVLWQLYRETRDRDNLRTVALALVCAGAIGNAIDRLRSAEGVVDFLDLGVGAVRWPTFNLADVAVTGGTALLAWALWGEDAAVAAPTPTSTTAPAAATAAPISTTPPTAGVARELPGGRADPA
jgi:signal peptidase II